MNTIINNHCSRLQSLLHVRPSEAERVEVERALQSKWEGVQVWSGRVLATWGGRRSVQALRAWLQSSLNKQAAWAVRGEAIRSLCRCYQRRDVAWMLDMYFAEDEPLVRHEFLPFITELPESLVRERIAVEIRSALQNRREAAQIATRRLEWWNRTLEQRSNMALQPTTSSSRKQGPKTRRAARG